MSIRKLSFAEIIIVRDDIAEVIVQEGVELDIRMVVEYHDFLIENLKAPFSLLVNKLNTYTYTFEAQRKLGTIPQIHAMAVVSYRVSTKLSQDALSRIPRTKTWNVRDFSDRGSAIDWLIEQQDRLTEEKRPPIAGTTNERQFLLKPR